MSIDRTELKALAKTWQQKIENSRAYHDNTIIVSRTVSENTVRIINVTLDLLETLETANAALELKVRQLEAYRDEIEEYNSHCVPDSIKAEANRKMQETT